MIFKKLSNKIRFYLSDLAGNEATEGSDGPLPHSTLGATFSVRRNLILSLFILVTGEILTFLLLHYKL